jgi:LPXTG-motif cell wall-anchored protein
VMRGLADLRWIAGIDERVLWATLAAALIMGLWGAFVGWRRRGS